MRKVVFSRLVQQRLGDLEKYLLQELLLSHEAALRYIGRMEAFVLSLSAPVNYGKCRFKAWRALGWRCTVFEKEWIIAYEDYTEGVIIRDIRHTKLMKQ